jgi:hypothetical protein
MTAAPRINGDQPEHVCIRRDEVFPPPKYIFVVARPKPANWERPCAASSTSACACARCRRKRSREHQIFRERALRWARTWCGNSDGVRAMRNCPIYHEVAAWQAWRVGEWPVRGDDLRGYLDFMSLSERDRGQRVIAAPKNYRSRIRRKAALRRYLRAELKLNKQRQGKYLGRDAVINWHLTQRGCKSYLSVNLYNFVKGISKRGKFQKLVGCTFWEFRRHIEAQWQPGMNWNNHSLYGWHIDHIRPLSSFNLLDPEERAAATHYTNLQPLWAKENLSKGGRYEPHNQN